MAPLVKPTQYKPRGNAVYLGCDPGKSGAIVALSRSADWLGIVRLDYTIDRRRRDLQSLTRRADVVCAVIESVHSMPGQGVASTFKFGRSYGELIALVHCVAPDARVVHVAPRKWQADMGCLTGGDKRITRNLAAEMSGRKVTHRVADAYLLARYALDYVDWSETD